MDQTHTLPDSYAKGAKGKANELVLTGDDRCDQCISKGCSCIINEGVIERWEARVAAGKPKTRTPAGAACAECRGKKYRCSLPRTKHLRRPALGKRKRTEGDDKEEEEEEKEEEPQGKKLRVSSSDEKSMEPFLTLAENMVRRVKTIIRHQRETSSQQARTADALQHIVGKLNGG